jgi:hypothetical protein
MMNLIASTVFAADEASVATSYVPITASMISPSLHIASATTGNVSYGSCKCGGDGCEKCGGGPYSGGTPRWKMAF